MNVRDFRGEIEYLIGRWLGPKRPDDIDEEEGAKFFIEDMQELIEKYQKEQE